MTTKEKNEKKVMVNFRIENRQKETLERLAAEAGCLTVDVIRGFLDSKTSMMEDIRRRKDQLLLELQNLQRLEMAEIKRMACINKGEPEPDE